MDNGVCLGRKTITLASHYGHGAGGNCIAHPFKSGTALAAIIGIHLVGTWLASFWLGNIGLRSCYCHRTCDFLARDFAYVGQLAASRINAVLE